MSLLKPNIKFLYFLISIFTVQFLLLLIAGGMFMDGAGNYQNEGNIILGILRYVFGFPIFWIIDFNDFLNNFDYFIIIIYLLNTYTQWIIYQYVKTKFAKN